MAFVSARATRTAVIVIALSAAGLWALRAMDAKADPPAMDDSSPCAEGRALFAAKLAYLEAHIAPEPSQEEAWRRFADAMRASAGEVDRACVEEPPRPLSVDAGERLETNGKACGRHASDVWRNGERLCGDRSQSDRSATGHPVAEHRSLSAIRATFSQRKTSPRRHGPELRPGRAGIPRLSAASGSFAVLISLKRRRVRAEARAPILAHHP